MSIRTAYLGVILIWGTTPLAIQWSGEGVGFLFGVTSRMLIGLAIALMLLAVAGQGLLWTRRACAAYLAGGLGIFGTMVCVYWSAQFIPSGWISVVFGLSPIITGILARYWLGTAPLAPLQWGGLLSALAGLTLIFGGTLEVDAQAVWGLLGVLVGATIQAASAVALKRIRADISGLTQAGGALLFAAPLFVGAWGIGDGQLPQQISPRTGVAILYLALFGSVVGFASYYYVLRHVDAVRVALITLITPVIALLLGNLLNAEAITREVVLGTALILSGLAMFQFGPNLRPAPAGQEVET